MSTWRCPHCGTPQAETSRCWACSRSPLTCRTCRHFRRAVAGRFGYCAMERARSVLIGDEMRACWQEPPAEPEPGQGLFRDLVAPPAPTGLVPIIRSSGPVRATIAVHHEVSRGSGGQVGTDERPVEGARGTPGVDSRGRPIAVVAPEARAGRLIEAPVVPPSGQLTSAAERQPRAQLLGIPAVPAADPAANPAASTAPVVSVEGHGLEKEQLQPVG